MDDSHSARGGLLITPLRPTEYTESAVRRVEALGRATATLRNALLRLAAPQSLASFLEAMAIETLAAADTENGAIVLLETEGNVRFVHPVVVVEKGGIVAASQAEAVGLGRAPIQGAFADYLADLERSEQGDEIDPQSTFLNKALRDKLKREGTTWIHNMPLRANGRMIGYIGAGYRERLENDGERIAMLRMLADQLAVSIEAVRLGRRAEELALVQEAASAAHDRAEQLAIANRSLTRSIQLLATGSGIDLMLSHVLQAICEQQPFAVLSSLWLVDAKLQLQSRRARFVQAEPTMRQPGADEPIRGPLDPLLFEPRNPSDTPRVSWLQQWSPNRQARARANAIESAIVFPICDGSRPIGAVVVERSPGAHPPGEGTLQIARTLAQQAMLAVRLEQAAQAAEDESREAATTAERARAARELHDTLAQGLTGTLMHIQAAQRMADPYDARAHLREAMLASKATLVEARRSMGAFRTQIRAGDFVAALTDTMHTALGTSGIDGCVVVAGTIRSLPKSNQHELLRIAQEAATNAVKHSRAANFVIRLLFTEDDLLQVSLEDDGIGFVPDAANGGYGLLGIEERVTRIGGLLTISSEPGTGVSLTFTIEHKAT